MTRPAWRTIWRRLPADGMAYAPNIDLYEKEDRLMAMADLPGVDRDNVDVSVTDSTLTNEGERKISADIKAEHCQRCEICYGSVSRSVPLPESVDSSKIEATFNNGVLTINLPKVPSAKPVKVEIKG